MSAYQVGPLVLSAPRFYAALALAVLVLAAEFVVWRRRSVARAGMELGGAPAEQVEATERRPVTTSAATTSSASWAWNAAFAVFIGARLGFVLENLGAFLDRPLTIVQFWQGGFSPWWGVGAGVLVALWSIFRRHAMPSTVVMPALLALAVWLVVPALLSPAQQQEGRLPAFALERLEGGELDMASLEGQPVVINLWATWCPPCRRELPMMATAARTHTDVHFVFANQVEARGVVWEYLDERDGLVMGGVVLDARGQLANQFGAVGLPTTLFFDAKGVHVLTHAGELSAVMMEKYLARVNPAEGPS